MTSVFTRGWSVPIPSSQPASTVPLARLAVSPQNASRTLAVGNLRNSLSRWQLEDHLFHPPLLPLHPPFHLPAFARPPTSETGPALLRCHTVEYRGFILPEIRGNVTKFAPQKALKFIARGKLTFDERVVVQRVEGQAPESSRQTRASAGAG